MGLWLQCLGFRVYRPSYGSDLMTMTLSGHCIGAPETSETRRLLESRACGTSLGFRVWDVVGVSGLGGYWAAGSFWGSGLPKFVRSRGTRAQYHRLRQRVWDAGFKV